jgi:hypothetical protein
MPRTFRLPFRRVKARFSEAFREVEKKWTGCRESTGAAATWTKLAAESSLWQRDANREES